MASPALSSPQSCSAVELRHDFIDQATSAPRRTDLPRQYIIQLFAQRNGFIQQRPRRSIPVGNTRRSCLARERYQLVRPRTPPFEFKTKSAILETDPDAPAAARPRRCSALPDDAGDNIHDRPACFQIRQIDF